jgi:hypothetical protein
LAAVPNFFRKPYGPGWALVGDAGYNKEYEFTTELATLEPPPPEVQQLLAAVHGNQEAMDGFARVNAGMTSPVEFFSEANVANILGTAVQRLAS